MHGKDILGVEKNNIVEFIALLHWQSRFMYKLMFIILCVL